MLALMAAIVYSYPFNNRLARSELINLKYLKGLAEADP
jgi:hypothetical protein